MGKEHHSSWLEDWQLQATAEEQVGLLPPLLTLSHSYSFFYSPFLPI